MTTSSTGIAVLTVNGKNLGLCFKTGVEPAVVRNTAESSNEKTLLHVAGGVWPAMGA